MLTVTLAFAWGFWLGAATAWWLATLDDEPRQPGSDPLVVRQAREIARRT